MAKRITDEDLRLNLIVNGDGGRKEMLALDRQMKDLQSSTKRTRTELKNLEKDRLTGTPEPDEDPERPGEDPDGMPGKIQQTQGCHFP